MQDKRTLAIQNNVDAARKAGIVQLTLEDEWLDGRFIQINHQRCINFASCSYLGLEHDPRLIEGVIMAARRYGSQFSASRAFLSVTLYRDVEKRMSQICNRPVIVGPSTTMVHQAAIPVLVGNGDAVIIDQKAHASVSTACRALALRGVSIELTAHNNMQRLERRIQRLQQKHNKIWYFLDGLYSMAGEFAPLEDLAQLLDQYEQLHLYADDAHSTGWQGVCGQGMVLQRLGHHARVVVALSMNKSFACAGGLLAVSDETMQQRIRDLGETLIFSGPIQPPMLGAICASADIHLSSELVYLQSKLRQKIHRFNSLCAHNGLTLVDDSISPIRFIEIGPGDKTAWLVSELLQRGYYVSPAGFPSVAKNRAGIRITMTNHLADEDLEGLTNVMAQLLETYSMTVQSDEVVA